MRSFPNIRACRYCAVLDMNHALLRPSPIRSDGSHCTTCTVAAESDSSFVAQSLNPGREKEPVMFLRILHTVAIVWVFV